jgi:Carboxypeptidase regulatory-like domain/TonB dependent receptor
MTRFLARSVVLLSTWLLLAAIAVSQSAQTGAISGAVTDPSGAVIGNATITIVNDATKNVERTVVSTADGLFAATLLPPGDYTVNVKAAGFKSYSAKATVLLNQATRLDAKLQVGTVSEVVEVTATAAVVNTESAVTGQPIDAATLQALPLPSPNFMFLLSLSAGTAGEFPDVRAANRGMVDINVNGQRTSNNSVTLEGINVNDFNLAHFDTIPLANPHAIEEFNVATSLYDASAGVKGGGAVGLVFKSGTKDWHGEAYWQHRNDFMNANEWVSNEVGAPRGKFLQNVLGFSGSGPMPLAGGNWFANVQGLRARNAVSPSGSVANVSTPVFPTNSDGTTSAALLASPAAKFNLTAPVDPTALNILNLKNSYYGGQFLIPRPGQPGCIVVHNPNPLLPDTLKCQFHKVTPVEDTQYVISYDRPFFGGKSKVSGRWFWDNGDSNFPFGTASSLAFPQLSIQKNRFAVISHTHEISNRQLNVFHVGYSRFISSFAPTDLVNLSDINATRPNSATVPGVYQVAVSGAFSFGTGVNDERGTVSNSFDYTDTWSLIVGKHSLKAGGEATRYQLNRFNRFALRGSLAFNNIQDFLTGTIDTLQSASGDPQRWYRATDFGAFFEDDYKVLSNLTLNLGLRWDSLQFAHDLLDRSTLYDPSRVPSQNPFIFPSNVSLPGLVGTPGVGDCGAPQCRLNKNFGPRGGFSWDVFRDHKTVVRGGYGVYFQRLSNQNFLQGSLGAPFFVQQLVNLPGTTLANPLPGQPASGAVATAFIPQNSHFVGVSGTGDPNNPANVPLFQNDNGQLCANFGGTAVNCSINLAGFATVAPNVHAPYNQQWNFGIQRDLGKAWILELDYVGAHYLGGLGIYNPFEAALASPSNPIVVKDVNGNPFTITTNTVNNEPLRVSALGLSRRRGSRVDGNVGFSMYDSGQLTLSHRFQKGLFLQTAYTWSKTIDNVSGSQSGDELNTTQNGQGGATLFNFGAANPALNRAIGDFDRPQRVVVSYVYDLPVPKNGIWGTQAFQGWGISGITTLQSGLPFSVIDTTGGRAFGGGVSTGIFQCSSIASAYTPGSVQSQIAAGQGYLNPACFAPAPAVPFSLPDPTKLSTNVPVTGFGNVPRNAFRGPRQQNWDASVMKHFKLHERNALDLRVDGFNIFNHPSFRQPSFVTIGQSTFGQINSTVTPNRLLQLGAQYSF